MIIYKLNKLVMGLNIALLGITGAYADTSNFKEPAIEIAESWTFKLTPSYYITTNTKDATDLNIRVNHGPHAAWLGYYRRDSEFEQTRTGYEYTLQLPFGQLIPSIQLATHEFIGGSINAKIGDSIFALLGLGRTNTRDYYNLNFDPNDSITYGFGTRMLPKSTISLFAVKDNRLNTDQIVTHVVWQMQQSDHQRWTVDLSTKSGRASADDETVSGNSLSVGYDYRNIFFRFAQDEKVNFTAEDQTRLTVGLRF